MDAVLLEVQIYLLKISHKEFTVCPLSKFQGGCSGVNYTAIICIVPVTYYELLTFCLEYM